jgi:sulfatase maturation enzyme AslB (radical SAM superfamily)
MSEFYCPLLWCSAAISPNSEVKPCCHYDSPRELLPSITTEDFETVFEHSDFFQALRDSKDIPQGCKRCIESHPPGGGPRDRSILEYGEPKTPQLRYLELAFDNVCNSKCRICFSSRSTAWIPDERKLLRPDKPGHLTHTRYTSKNLPSAQSLKELTKLKIIGGEPFLSPRHDSFLEELVKEGISQNIHAQYNTNSTVFPSDEILSNLSTFKTLDMRLSIDGTGAVNEILRPPTDWQTVDQTCDRWLAYTNEHGFDCKLMATFSIYNIFRLDELYEWFVKKQESFPHFSISFNPVVYPKYLSLELLTPEDAKLLIEKYQNYDGVFQEVITCLQTLPKGTQTTDFKDFNTQLDVIRNENLFKVLPELRTYLL